MNTTPRPPEIPSEEHLESWKEIAAYLGKGVRTVVRWEKTEGLPVHRHLHEKRSSVFAYKSEIDIWWRNRRAVLDQETPPAPPLPIRWRPLAVGVGGAIVLAGFATWLLQMQQEAPERPLKTEPLTAYPGQQYSPSFSPDGSHFAFVWNGPEQENWDVYVQAVGGGSEPRRLTDHPRLDFSPAWSPDGKWIAFLRRWPDRRTELLLLPALGGAERKLADLGVPHYMEATGIAWTPDAKSVIVAAAREGQFGLYLISVESGEERRLTQAKWARDHLDPALSPDGKSLAFRCENNDVQSEICVLALGDDLQPNGAPARLTSLGRRSTTPVWVADGRDLIFSSGVFQSDTNLYRTTVFPARKRSGAVRQLTWGVEEQFSLSVSRRGDLMAYTRRLSEINLWSVTWDPTTQRASEPSRLLSSNRADLEPDFSPDGNRIAFASNRSGSMEIWIAQSDGSQARKLTSFGPKPAVTPRWSPDGRTIVFSAGEVDREELYLIAPDGGPARRLGEPLKVAGGFECGRQPSWSRDGKWIYYSAAVNGVAQIFRISAAGGRPHQVTTAGGCNPQESPDGRYIYHMKEGGVWRIPLAGGSREQMIRNPNLYLSYVVGRDGIFALPLFTLRPWTMEFHRFSDGSVSAIAHGDKRTCRGLALSRDGRRILYPLTDGVRMNLMLVRNPG